MNNKLLKVLKKIGEVTTYSDDTLVVEIMLSKLFDSYHGDGKIAFFISIDKDDLTIFGFGFYNIKRENVKETEALEAINSSNNKIKYGKIILDDDGDISWAYSCNIDNINEQTAVMYCKSCIIGVMNVIEELKKKENGHG